MKKKSQGFFFANRWISQILWGNFSWIIPWLLKYPWKLISPRYKEEAKKTRNNKDSWKISKNKADVKKHSFSVTKGRKLEITKYLKRKGFIMQKFLVLILSSVWWFHLLWIVLDCSKLLLLVPGCSGLFCLILACSSCRLFCAVCSFTNDFSTKEIYWDNILDVHFYFLFFIFLLHNLTKYPL